MNEAKNGNLKSQAESNNSQPTPKTKSNLSKAERLWKRFFMAMLVLFGAIFYSISALHKNLDEQGIPHARFSDLILTVLAACLWHVIKNTWEYKVTTLVYPYLEDKHQGLERAHRARRVAKWFFDVVYYSSFTFFSFYFFQPILPVFLFGKEECKSAYDEYPKSTMLKWAKEYYLIQMGSLMQKVVDQLVNKRNDAKFWEYFLHHFLAFCLMFQSYIANYDRIGILILMTHDLTDIFLALVRAQEALRYKIPVFFPAFFIVTFFVWTYFRGVAYTFCELIPTYIYLIDKHIKELNKHGAGSVFSDAAFFVELTFLEVMNLYWIYALGGVFFKNIKHKGAANIIKGGTYINNYDPTLLKDDKSTPKEKNN